MRPIIILEPNIANKIAAGEVVERPASIIKELLENSIDAGATSVTVEIQNGGIDHIRITDNGCGIPEGEVKTAFMRHATSKLTSIDELSELSSFGFRGEALASIAAVSKVTIRTRTESSDYGIRLSVNGGEFSQSEICACPAGTTIEVDELFYNVPARLKFVKNARTEAAMITDYASRLMLANPGVSIKLLNSGRTVLQTVGDGSLANAVLCVYGGSVFAAMHEVDYDDGYIAVKGYVGSEHTARANRTQQSVFINKRYIKSAVVSNAVQRAFLTRVMNHRFPFFVLNLLISSREVDVNVHPNKLSVRFGDEERVSRAVTTAIEQALSTPPVTLSAAGLIAERYAQTEGGQEVQTSQQEGASAFGGPSTRGSEAGLERQVRDIFGNGNAARFGRYGSASDGAEAGSHTAFNCDEPGRESHDYALHDSGSATHSGGAYPDFTYSRGADPGYAAGAFNGGNPVDRDGTADLLNSGNSFADGVGVDADISAREQDGSIPVYRVPSPVQRAAVEPRAEQIALDADTCTVLGAAFDTYIIVQQGDALYYIDQHAAHERMLYEKLISGQMRFDSQFVSPPIELELDPIAFDVLLQNEERFSEFGYSIEFCSDLKVKLNSIPGIHDISPGQFLLDALDMMQEFSGTTETDIMRSRLIQMSCKKAVKAGNDLEIRQLKAIVDAYATGEVPLTCPHGRPVIIRVTKRELQKMFKRII